MPRVDLGLPVYDDGSETLYLERIAGSRKDYYALMDRKNIPRGPVGSKIEFCDLFTGDNSLIHVKRYGNAGVLSHLFSQGLASAELLLVDSEFRAEVRKRLPESHLHQVPIGRPSPDDYRVIFAIISQSTGPLSLPFFSRLSLRHAARKLEGFGFKVALAKVDVAPLRRMLKKVPAKDRNRGAKKLHAIRQMPRTPRT